MDPHNRGPEEDAPMTAADDISPIRHVQQPSSQTGTPGPRAAGAARTAHVVAGDYLLTVNPVDGSEVELCPRDRVPPAQRREGRSADSAGGRRDEDERDAHRRAALHTAPLLGRDEESERLIQLVSRGRSVRVTGPSGSGRTALLSAMAERCTALAPDGVIRLSGYQRTPADLLYDLYAGVYRADGARPDRPQLLERIRGIGAVVVLDDIEFGGAALEELLFAAAECAFLISATPDVAAPSPDSHIEEVVLSGLSKAACLELLEQTAGRSLTDQERGWAEDLWFACEGLPLRFVQAGALLRHRHVQPQSTEDISPVSDAETSEISEMSEAGEAPEPLLPLAEAVAPAEALAAVVSPAAQQALRYAVALGGDCPHPSHLPALVGDPHADEALGELVDCGLVTITGSHLRLAAGVCAQLVESVPDTGAKARAAAEHYIWWTGHPSIIAERIGAEAAAVIAAMSAAKTCGQPGVAVQLARTAAPAFAAALNWGAWERALRIGRESARLAGETGEEAYFHHELGVLALCSGNPGQARTELEASIGMRGALADRQGTVVGRRTLALVMDRLGGRKPLRRPLGPVSEDLPDVPGVPAVPAVPVVPGIRSASPQLPVERRLPVVERAPLHQPVPAVADMTDTVATPLMAVDAPSHQERVEAAKSRRNLAVAGAGAVLAAVFGTVVTIGVTSGHRDTHSTPTSTIPSETEQPTDGISFPAEPPAAANGASRHPSAPPSAPSSASPSASPSMPGSPSPSASPTAPGDPARTDSRSFLPPQRRTHKPTPTPSSPSNPPPSTSPSNPPPSTSPSPIPTPSPTPLGQPPPDPHPSSQPLASSLPSSDSTSDSPLSSSPPAH